MAESSVRVYRKGAMTTLSTLVEETDPPKDPRSNEARIQAVHAKRLRPDRRPIRKIAMD